MPSSSATRARKRRLEVQLAAHRPIGEEGDLLLVPAVGGHQLDHLALDQRGVDVDHDQAHGASQQARRLDGDVEALRGRLDREQGAQPVRVGAGDVQVDRGDGVARHALDAVDVGPTVGDPPGDGGHGARGERGADHGHVRPALAATPVVAGAAIDLDVHPELVGRGLDGSAQRLPVARGSGHQDAEDQSSAEHDLLDVEHLDAGACQRAEHRRGHPRPVLPGDREQQRLRPVIRHGASRLLTSGPTCRWRSVPCRDMADHTTGQSGPTPHLRLRRAGGSRHRGGQDVLRRRSRLELHRLRPGATPASSARAARVRSAASTPSAPRVPGCRLVVLYSDDLEATLESGARPPAPRSSRSRSTSPVVGVLKSPTSGTPWRCGPRPEPGSGVACAESFSTGVCVPL